MACGAHAVYCAGGVQHLSLIHILTTARQMYEAVTDRFDSTDVLIMAAAVADYRPATVANDKIKKKEGDLSIPCLLYTSRCV